MQSVNFSYKTSSNLSYGSRIGHPSIWFKLGVNDDPYLPLYTGTTASTNHQFTDKITVKSGFVIFKNLSFNIQYANDKSTSESSGQKTITRKTSFIPLGDTGSEGIPFFTWSTSMSGLEKLPYVGKIFKSVSLQHNYSGDRNWSVRDTTITTDSYSRSFSPLIGVNTKTKGKNPIDISLNYKHTTTFSNTGATTNKTIQKTISSTFKYNMKGGIKIPILFFKNMDISNDMKFTLNIQYDKSEPWVRYTRDGDFALEDETKNFSIKPNLNYNFTKYVSGGMHFNIREDVRNGKRTEKDFGFNVRILIQG